MIGRTNVGGGGNTFAFIVVTYPEGSVCTCTDGTRTIRAKGTTGSFVFNIPYAATWKVECHNDSTGEMTESGNIVISTLGQSVDISLSYLLPVQYQLVEYIHMSGTQYIAYNFQPKRADTLHVEAGLLLEDSGSIALNCLFHGKTSAVDDCTEFSYRKSDNKFLIGWGVEKNGAFRSSIINQHYDYVGDYANGTQTLSILNGTDVITGNSSSGSATLHEVQLFRGLGTATSASAARFVGKCYYVKMKLNGNDLIELYPCYRKSDSVAGFYDVVNDVFYTNAGTGSFIVGGNL